MRNDEKNLRCGMCHEIRTVIQIRQILNLPKDVDVLVAVRDMKSKLDNIENTSTSDKL